MILGILAGQKMLENPEDAARFTEKLKTVFGASGAKTLQFVIAKELYRRLGIPFDPDGLFDYATVLETARQAFFRDGWTDRPRISFAPMRVDEYHCFDSWSFVLKLKQ